MAVLSGTRVILSGTRVILSGTRVTLSGASCIHWNSDSYKYYALLCTFQWLEACNALQH